MSDENCILTTKDLTVLEVMLERSQGFDERLVLLLRRKINSATIMFGDDVPANVATMSSRVIFSVNGRGPDTRVISRDRMAAPVGMFLPVTSIRGLALLGLSEGQECRVAGHDGEEELILLEQVLYQPEAARREKEAMAVRPAPAAERPALKLIRGAIEDEPELQPSPQPRTVTTDPGGFDDPGPSAA